MGYYYRLKNSDFEKCSSVGVSYGLLMGGSQGSGSTCRFICWRWFFFWITGGVISSTWFASFLLLCNSHSLTPAFQKAPILFQPVWYCEGRLRGCSAKELWGLFHLTPSPRSAAQVVALRRTRGLSSKHWRAEEWDMGSAEQGMGSSSSKGERTANWLPPKCSETISFFSK